MRLIVIIALASILASPASAQNAPAPAGASGSRYAIENVAQVSNSKGSEVWILDTQTGLLKVCYTAASGDTGSDKPVCTPWTK
jgi:hypothetical protein